LCEPGFEAELLDVIRESVRYVGQCLNRSPPPKEKVVANLRSISFMSSDLCAWTWNGREFRDSRPAGSRVSKREFPVRRGATPTG
jgi:hypothetical protein